MKKKQKKEKKLMNFKKKRFENSLQPWEFGALSDIFDFFERQPTVNVREMRNRFLESVSRMFLSPENSKYYIPFHHNQKVIMLQMLR